MRTLTFLLAILLRSLAVCENVRVVQSVDILPPRPYYFEDIIAACEERIEDQHRGLQGLRTRARPTPLPEE